MITPREADRAARRFLQAIGTALVHYGMPLAALPVLCLLKHLATDCCRDVGHSMLADALSIWALGEAGQVKPRAHVP